MTWILIISTVAVGFGEYCCAHYLIQKILRITENRAHLLLAVLISGMVLLPRELIWTVFMLTMFFTPLVLWVGISFSRSRK